MCDGRRRHGSLVRPHTLVAGAGRTWSSVCRGSACLCAGSDLLLLCSLHLVRWWAFAMLVTLYGGLMH